MSSQVSFSSPSETTLSLEKLIAPSEYDNSLSFLYKKAIGMGVPLNYVIIQPARETDIQTQEVFDLEEHQNAHFTNIFSLIANLLDQDSSLTLFQIWEILSKIKGDSLDPIQLIPIWLQVRGQTQRANNLDQLFQEIQIYLKNLKEAEIFSSFEEVINFHKQWVQAYNQELTRDYGILLKYVRAQQELASIQPLKHSEIQLESLTLSYDYPTEIGINPLPEIFNSAHTSYLVPFIQYNIQSTKGQLNNLEIERYYRIYKGQTVDFRPNYSNIILSTEQTPGGNTIYLNVWQGSEGEARKGKKEGFSPVSLSYIETLNKPGILRVTFNTPLTETVNERVMINRIHTHLSYLPRPGEIPGANSLIGPASQIKEIKISGFFMIYSIDLVEVVLSDLIMNDPLFNSYLYLEESNKSLAEKTRFNVHYTGLATKLDEKTKRKSGATATLYYRIINPGEQYTIVQPQGVETYISESPLSTVVVRITKASSRKVADKFLNILTRLFRRYQSNGKEILEKYLRYVPEYEQVLREKSSKETQGMSIPASIPSALSRIAQLQQVAPDIFKPGYSRKCQPIERYPLIISPEEVPIWQRRKISIQGLEEFRQVLSFPKDKPRFYFVCPDDQYPYPGVIENKTLSNRASFEYLPCCFNLDQFKKTKSPLNRYLEGTLREVKATSKTTHILKNPLIADPGRRGLLNTLLSSFLPQYSQTSGTFQRYGVPRSYNSFIHCVALALNDQSYLSSENREEWTREFRRNLPRLAKSRKVGNIQFFEPLYPEFLKQELYEMTNEEIVRNLTDNETFFDPLLYYRALEWYYNCTIYVFPMSDQDRSGKTISMMSLPRHRHFHVHPPEAGRPVILILRHWGGDANALEYPQCELIVEVDGEFKESISKMYFDERMNKLLYEALSFVSRTITWQIYESDTGPTLTSRLNLYSTVNYQKLFGEIFIEGQVIDNAGKARVFVLAPEFANPEGTALGPTRIFVNVPPTAPLNVPEYKLENAIGKLPPYQKTIKLFGDPTGATTSIDGRLVTGLWFPLGDIVFGIYTPTLEVPWDEISKKYPRISRNTELAALTVNIPRSGGFAGSLSSEHSPIQRIKYLSRVAKFTIQIIKYLYLIAGRPQDLQQFLGSILTMLDPKVQIDSMLLYKIGNLPRVLPLPDSKGDPLSSVLRKLNSISPEFFPGGRIILYDLKMYEGILFQMNRFIKEIKGLEFSPSYFRVLQGYYDNKEDFKTNPELEFFLGTLREYNLWLKIYVPSLSLQERTIQNLKDNIQTRLNSYAFPYQEPYIYQEAKASTVKASHNPRDDKFYLIQNVAGGDFLRAINVAYTWYLKKQNLGYRAEPYDIEKSSGLIPVHIIYRISPGGHLLKQDDRSQGSREALEILDYGTGIFAALLPIL